MATKAKPIPEGYHAVTPSLTLKNSLKALAFYKRAFGAEVKDVFSSPDGGLTMHAVMKIGDSIVMIGDEMPNMNCKSAESLGASPVNLYLYVPNVDEVFKKAVDAGATSTMPVADMFWGDRCGTLKDPFGYSWTIATHLQDKTHEEVDQGAKEFFARAGKA